MALEPSVRDIGARNVLVEWLGAFIRGSGDWFPVAFAVESLGEVGMDESSVRMAISRLKARDWLVQERRGGSVGYTLTETALETLAAGDAFIYHSEVLTDLSAGWVIVAFSVPESLRSKRHALKARLVAAGFGHTGPGLLIAPARMLGDARRIVRDLDMTDFVELFTAHYEGADIEHLVARGWDMSELGDRYERFLQLAESVLSRWSGGRTPTGRQALDDYLIVLHEWRLVAYSDPRLPGSLLGAEWAGDRARAAFSAVIGVAQPVASRYVEERSRIGGVWELRPAQPGGLPAIP